MNLDSVINTLKSIHVDTVYTKPQAMVKLKSWHMCSVKRMWTAQRAEFSLSDGDNGRIFQQEGLPVDR